MPPRYAGMQVDFFDEPTLLVGTTVDRLYDPGGISLIDGMRRHRSADSQ
jgi:hypothetical protein